MSSSKKALNVPAPSFSKISPPSLPKILLRPRLQAIFEQNKDKKLILIIGQAAQGKSTVAATWYFLNAQRPSIWINLGPEDSDPASLFYLLVSAIAAQLKIKDTKQLHSLPSQRLGPRESRYNFREWASALFKTFDRPFQLFLDGLDRLDPQDDSFQFLQALVEGLPPLVRLVITARAYPPLTFEFQSLKLGRQALLLQNEDLAFSPPEINRLFQELHGLSLSGEQIERIHKATEGWIGGIILLAQCLEGLPESSLNEYLTHRLPDRFQREVFQFFGKEAFSALTPSQQNFLLRSSLLDRLESGILRELFPDEDALELLKPLAGRNLFVTGFPDPHQGMVFRLHRLFKAFLRTLLQSKSSEDEIRQLHRRAGDYYRKEGDEEEALRQYLEARAYPEAAERIKQIGLTLIKQTRLKDLGNWLNALPKPFIQEDPWLLLFQGLINGFTFPQEDVVTLQGIVVRFMKQGDCSGLLLSLAHLIEVEITRGIYRPGLIRWAERLLKSSAEDAYLFERALLWSQIGLVQAVRGNPRQGYWACQNTYLLANRLEDRLMQATALSRAVSCLSRLGEFREAERLLTELDPLLWRLNRPEIHAFLSLSRILFLALRGDHQASLDHCGFVTAEIEKQGLSYLFPYTLIYRQLALTFAREYDQADQIGRQVIHLAEKQDNEFLKGAALLMMGVSAYWAGRPVEARTFIDQCIALFRSPAGRSDCHLPRARLIRGLLENRSKNRATAIREIREVLEYFQSNENHLLVTESHLALGLLYQDAGQPAEARTHLHKGFALARQRAYDHFIAISPRDVRRACLLALEFEPSESSAAGYANDLLIRKFSVPADPELIKLSHHPDPDISQKMMEIRRTLHRKTIPILHLETFGGLRLYRNEKQISDNDWNRQQPRRLLTAILSQKNSLIPKEVLIELLWPEENPDVGEKNFKTTLSRLRKTLEQEISPDFGSSYVHLHRNTVFLDDELCRTDVRQFGDRYREGLAKENKKNVQGAQECFSQALELYRGDFLPEERYAPWVEQRREDLKNGYLDLLTRTARYHEQAGAFRKAVFYYQQALQADPLLEDACRGLMSLYAEKNLFNEAFRVFESCRKSLKAALNTTPDSVTLALYQGIRQRANKS
jgi:LuxR family transcriptional regulator, maltose regulon positive regulatory protein